MNCYCCIVIALVEKGDTPFVSLKKVVYATHPDAPDQLKSSSVLRSTHKIAFKHYIILCRLILFVDLPVLVCGRILLSHCDLWYDDS